MILLVCNIIHDELTVLSIYIYVRKHMLKLQLFSKTSKQYIIINNANFLLLVFYYVFL